MSVSKSDLQEALIEGATDGLTSGQLFVHVREKFPKAKTEKIVRAAFRALSEPTLKDRSILDVLYALALQHRLDERDGGGDDDGDAAPPKALKKLIQSKAAILPLPERAVKRGKKAKGVPKSG